MNIDEYGRSDPIYIHIWDFPAPNGCNDAELHPAVVSEQFARLVTRRCLSRNAADPAEQLGKVHDAFAYKNRRYAESWLLIVVEYSRLIIIGVVYAAGSHMPGRMSGD